jgi:hypothetical protein
MIKNLIFTMPISQSSKPVYVDKNNAQINLRGFSLSCSRKEFEKLGHLSLKDPRIYHEQPAKLCRRGAKQGFRTALDTL